MKQSTLQEFEMSTRTQNILTRMAEYRDWPDFLKAYKQDPNAVETSFLRVPGAGMKSLDELKAILADQLKGFDSTSQVVWLTKDQMREFDEALNEVCHSIHSRSGLYGRLRALQHVLARAKTIHTRI